MQIKWFNGIILAKSRDVAGWSSSVARRAHNPKVVGSNPASATTVIKGFDEFLDFFMHRKVAKKWRKFLGLAEEIKNKRDYV